MAAFAVLWNSPFTPEVRSLEAFVLRPLDNPREMGPLAETTLDRLCADPELRAAYAAAFPGQSQARFAELGCAGCHRGPTLSSESYLNTGVTADISRNSGQARVPSLIGLAQTAPYFHDGSAATLIDVVRAYQRGGMALGPGVNAAISPFVITDAELRDLVAYLSSL